MDAINQRADTKGKGARAMHRRHPANIYMVGRLLLLPSSSSSSPSRRPSHPPPPHLYTPLAFLNCLF